WSLPYSPASPPLPVPSPASPAPSAAATPPLLESASFGPNAPPGPSAAPKARPARRSVPKAAPASERPNRRPWPPMIGVDWSSTSSASASETKATGGGVISAGTAAGIAAEVSAFAVVRVRRDPPRRPCAAIPWTSPWWPLDAADEIDDRKTATGGSDYIARCGISTVSRQYPHACGARAPRRRNEPRRRAFPLAALVPARCGLPQEGGSEVAGDRRRRALRRDRLDEAGEVDKRRDVRAVGVHERVLHC